MGTPVRLDGCQITSQQMGPALADLEPKDMKPPPAVSALVLASGLSRRFGLDDKLMTPLWGKPLAAHIADTLRTVPLKQRIAVYSNPAVATLFEDFELAHNEQPERGMGYALRLGLERAQAPFVLICLADMPRVSGELLRRLCSGADAGGMVSSSDDYLGPPALIARQSMLDLPLDGDQGARALLQGLPRLHVDASELLDVDSQADWRRLSEN